MNLGPVIRNIDNHVQPHPEEQANLLEVKLPGPQLTLADNGTR